MSHMIQYEVSGHNKHAFPIIVMKCDLFIVKAMRLEAWFWAYYRLYKLMLL